MGSTFVTWPSLIAGQVALIAGLLFLFCGALSWWLYRRELLLSRQRRKAEERARRLLVRLLNVEEQEQLQRWAFLEIPSRTVLGRVYQIPMRRGQVQIYDHGRHTGGLCIEATRWVPDSDLILMHKLMIEANEEEYLRTANLFQPFKVA